MCCFFDTKTQEYRFQAAATTRSYLTAVLKNHQVDLVVMEACGPSGWINDLCQEVGSKTLVCSTNEEAWRWANVKRKTDKDDARIHQTRKKKAAIALARKIAVVSWSMLKHETDWDPKRRGIEEEQEAPMTPSPKETLPR